MNKKKIKASIIGLAIAAGLAAVGCSQVPDGDASGNRKQSESSEQPQPSALQSMPVNGNLFYQNPVVKNGADPSVLRASDGKYYAYVTGNGFRAFSSSDLVSWKAEGQTLPLKEVESWADTAFWAPDVVEVKNKFYMFFSAAKKSGSTFKPMSVAVSDKPTGPFSHPEKNAIFSFGEEIDREGVIDPHVFVDSDGKIYMYFVKTLHEVGDHRESHIYVVELNEDMKSYKGKPIQLTQPEQEWENKGKQRWNEGPWMIKNKDTYYLMYSANCYCNRNYGVGYATSKSPLGPFKKWESNPVIQAEFSQVSGTGHHSVVKSPDGSELWMVYHSHEGGKPGEGRQLNLAKMGFREDGTLYVNGPTITKQAKPSGATEWRNIAANADITVSSSKIGSPRSLVDGEIGMYARFAKYDWVPKAESTSWINMEWREAKELSTVLLYDSGDSKRAVASGKLQLDDGTVYSITFPKEPGAAAMVELGGKKVKSIKFSLAQDSSEKEYGISEITVLGK
jgi:GH43 family beta-xylosidase